MSNVLEIGKEVKRPKAGELAQRIQALIAEYDGELGICEAVGALECCKHVLLTNQLFDIVDHD